jgi:hypothetical protein
MKSMKWISILVICLLTDVSVSGQISATSANANSGQSSEIQNLPGLLPADSGYVIYTYDDGIAENYFAWQMSGNMNAVKFLLQSEAATIVGARVFVGDGSYPAGGNILNQPFLVSVYASDGENGLPGTLIDSVSASVTNYGWVMVKGLNAFVTADFFIAITQLTNAPDCIPIGVDETAPKVSQSYARNMISGNSWVLSPYQDLMINALISTNVGLDEPQALTEVKIYPNPANESVKIEFSIPMKTITLKNASGQILLNQNITNQPTFFINTSSMLSGIYFIRFDTANGDSFTRKLVVLH